MSADQEQIVGQEAPEPGMTEAEIDDIVAAFEDVAGKRKKEPFKPPLVGASDPTWTLIDGTPLNGVIQKVEGRKVRASHTASCGRCGGRGGSDHWPGYKCFRCNGRGALTETRRVYTRDQVEAVAASKRRKLETEATARAVRAQEAMARAEEAGFDTRQAHADLFALMDRIRLAEKDGFAASVLQTFSRTGLLSDKQIESLRTAATRLIEREADARTSRHVGEQGRRIEKNGVCVHKASFAYNVPGRWNAKGVVYLATLRDREGNVFLLRSSAPFEFEKGDQVDVKGTIKEHTWHENVAQTVLSRVKILHYVSRRQLDMIVDESNASLAAEETADDAPPAP